MNGIASEVGKAVHVLKVDIIEFVFMALCSSDRKEMIQGKLSISTREYWKAKFLEQSLFGNCSVSPVWCCKMKKLMVILATYFER